MAEESDVKPASRLEEGLGGIDVLVHLLEPFPCDVFACHNRRCFLRYACKVTTNFRHYRQGWCFILFLVVFLCFFLAREADFLIHEVLFLHVYVVSFSFFRTIFFYEIERREKKILALHSSFCTLRLLLAAPRMATDASLHPN
jgi:hypothetical protein